MREAKESPAATSSKRHEPYKKSKRPSKSTVSKAKSKAAPAPPPSTLAAWPTLAKPDEVVTEAEICWEVSQKLYPTIPLRDVFDAAWLSGGDYNGPLEPEKVYAWIEEELLRDMAKRQWASREEYEETMLRFWSQPADVTGRKPKPGDPRVLVRAIPDCDLSIRLWPGVATEYEYCIDFVHTETGVAANAPPGFKLYRLPDPAAPTLFGVGLITSMEQNFGVKPSEMRPGEEKFIVQEGAPCMLVRPGKQNVRFRIPRRRRIVPPTDDVVLDFPELVD